MVTRGMQPSFAAGEVAPSLYGRVDLAKYQIGLRTCKNFIVRPHGGVVNRPGTEFVFEVKDSADRVRLIPFAFSTEQTYVLEFGDYYLRVVSDGAMILEEPNRKISDVTQANPGVVTTSENHGYLNGETITITEVVGMTELNGNTYTIANKTVDTFELSGVDTTGYGAYVSGGIASFSIASTTAADPVVVTTTASHGYANGDVVYITDVVTARELNSRWFTIANKTATTFELVNEDGTGTGYGAGTGGTVKRVFWLTTPYPKEDLQELIFVQSADVMTIVHPSYAPRELARTDHDEWTLTEITIGPGIDAPTNLATAGAGTYTYAVTAIDEDTGEESAAATESTGVAADTVTWTASTGAKAYYVYRDNDNGQVPGFVGLTEGTTFKTLAGTEPDFASMPPEARDPFGADGSSECPAAVCYYEQRLAFGGTNGEPQHIWMSQSYAYHNMDMTRPVADNASIWFRLAARQVNRIRHLVALQDLVVFTSGGEWRVSGGDSSILTPTEITIRQQSEYGAGLLPPIVVGSTAIYYQDRGPAVRDLAYDFTQDRYIGSMLSILSHHLLENYTLEEWAFAQAPFAVIWVVRDDGTLLGITYMREHQVVAWHRHETTGFYESVASIREGADDAIYVAVRRVIDGSTKRYIERMHSRFISNVRDCFFVDAGLTLDSPITMSGATKADPVVVTTSTAHGLSDGDKVDISDVVGMEELNDHQFQVGWILESSKAITAITQASEAQVTAVGHGYATDDRVYLESIVGMTELNDREFTIMKVDADNFTLNDEDSTGHTAYTSGGTSKRIDEDQFELQDPTSGDDIDGSAYTTYESGGNVREAVTTVTGLDHLEGETVSVLANGHAHTDEVVSSGAITLDYPASRVHVGLPYTSDIETLDLEIPTQEGTIQGRRQNVRAVTLRVEDSRGAWAGPDEDNLYEIPWRMADVPYDQPTELETKDMHVGMAPDWSEGARIFVRQTYPLPLAINAIIPELVMGDSV